MHWHHGNWHVLDVPQAKDTPRGNERQLGVVLCVPLSDTSHTNAPPHPHMYPAIHPSTHICTHTSTHPRMHRIPRQQAQAEQHGVEGEGSDSGTPAWYSSPSRAWEARREGGREGGSLLPYRKDGTLWTAYGFGGLQRSGRGVPLPVHTAVNQKEAPLQCSLPFRKNRHSIPHWTHQLRGVCCQGYGFCPLAKVAPCTLPRIAMSAWVRGGACMVWPDHDIAPSLDPQGAVCGSVTTWCCLPSCQVAVYTSAL